MRIDRKSSINEISSKLLDYSATTIEQLRNEGYRDTLKTLQKNEV